MSLTGRQLQATEVAQMEGGFSFSEETGNGSDVTFLFEFSGPFPAYIRESDVTVWVRVSDEVEPEYGTWVQLIEDFIFHTPTSITLDTVVEAPGDGLTNIRIRRIMPKEVPYASTSTDAVFRKEVLNNSFLQQLYIQHEVLDGFIDADGGFGSPVNINGHYLYNLARGFEPHHSVNKEQMDEVQAAVDAVIDEATAQADRARVAADDAEEAAEESINARDDVNLTYRGHLNYFPESNRIGAWMSYFGPDGPVGSYIYTGDGPFAGWQSQIVVVDSGVVQQRFNYPTTPTDVIILPIVPLAVELFIFGVHQQAGEDYELFNNEIQLNEEFPGNTNFDVTSYLAITFTGNVNIKGPLDAQGIWDLQLPEVGDAYIVNDANGNAPPQDSWLVNDVVVYGEELEWINLGSIVGPAGEDGTDGDTGAQGEQGEQGEQGDTGDTGLTGDQGIQGGQGDQGIQGETGADSTVPGPQGDQGDQGIQGETGATGADSTVPGPQGDPGEQGPQGDPGIGIEFQGRDAFATIMALDATLFEGHLWTTANSGVISEPGHPQDTQPVAENDGLLSDGTWWIWTGPFQGEQGEQGDTGAQGETGDQGIQGETGADSTVPGPQGDQGDQGDIGLTGDTGEQGPIGITGAEGPQGDSIESVRIGPGAIEPGFDSLFVTIETQLEAEIGRVEGDAGTNGIDGEDGATGDTGPQGEQGGQGDTGLTGDTGPQGVPGPPVSGAVLATTATEGQTIFPMAPNSDWEAGALVNIDGVEQVITADYTIAVGTITLTTGAGVSQVVLVKTTLN